MKTSSKFIALSVVGVVALAACGGGGDGDAGSEKVSGSDVPLSATTSSAGATAFVKQVASTKDDTANPLVVGDATLATSETDEPDPGV